MGEEGKSQNRRLVGCTKLDLVDGCRSQQEGLKMM